MKIQIIQIINMHIIPHNNFCSTVNQEPLKQTSKSFVYIEHNNHFDKSMIDQSNEHSINVRHRQYKIKPIMSDCSQDEEQFTQIQTKNKNELYQEYQELTPLLKQKKIKRKIIRKRIKKDIDWDSCQYEKISQELSQANKTFKSKSYSQLEKVIQNCFEKGSIKGRLLLVQGKKQCGKTTMIMQVLENVKHRLKLTLNCFFLQFDGEADNKKKDKIHKLVNFLKQNIYKTKNNVIKLTMTEQTNNNFTNQVNQHQINDIVKEGNLTHNNLISSIQQKQVVILINNYQQFIIALKRSNELENLKMMMLENTHVILIFKSCSSKPIIQKLIPQMFMQILAEQNSKQYFLNCMLTSINNYSFAQQRWTLMRPLANYFCCKLQKSRYLQLSIIKKFIKFLQNYKQKIQIHAESQENEYQTKKVNQSIIQQFYSSMINKQVKFDLLKLSLHEKCVLIAFFTSLKQYSQLLTSCVKIFKLYKWVCQSLKISPKNQKEFRGELLYQLETYKFVRIIDGRIVKKQKELMLNMDVNFIKQTFQNQFLFAKFFKQTQQK